MRTTSTDAEGRYAFAALAVGTYRLRVAAPGFRTWEREGLLAAVGRALVVDVGLVLAASEAVTVHREGTADGNQGAAVAALTEARSIDGLPANGRDFVAFSLLSPAVVAERTPPTGPTASSGLSFAGQRARANHVMVDGFDNDDAFTGAVAAAFSQEAVREFQVLAASAPAEFGHAAGGTVNTVTKSGSNDWHGSAFFFLRDRALNSKEHFEKVDVFGNPVDAPKGPFHQAQWGATLGGPLRKDRTFAFLSFERRSLDAANFVTIDPGVAASLEAAGFEIALGSVPYAQRTWSALAKLDHTFAPNHRLTVRGHLSDRTQREHRALRRDRGEEPWSRSAAHGTSGSRPRRRTSSPRAGSTKAASSSSTETRTSTASIPRAAVPAGTSTRAGRRSPCPGSRWPAGSSTPRSSAGTSISSWRTR